MKHYVGVDLGGTNIAVGIVTEDGVLIHKDSVPTRITRGPEPVIADIAALCKKAIADSGVDAVSVRGVGVGSPGICDDENGVILYANNLFFRDVPIRALLQKEMDLPIRLGNDGDCAALGEATAGAAKGSDISVTITLGTGIGGGIIIGGKIINGAYGGGGEVGHIMLYDGKEACTCGRHGCWEAYASATGLIRQATAAVACHPESRIAALAGHDMRHITGKVVFDAADEGDETAQTVIDRYLHYVAAGLIDIINLLQPNTIVLGGGICAQGDRILTPIREMVAKEVYGGYMRTNIVIATLGNDAGIIGAAMLALEDA